MRDATPAFGNSFTPPKSGVWLVGVSGGADSVALLIALRSEAPETRLIVCHLNHETRGAESDGDALFVADLCQRLGVPCFTRRLSDCPASGESNLEARFRTARHQLFKTVAADHACAGVLLAHHADDRAETAMLRLLRNGEPTAIDGLRRETTIDGLRFVRPLIDIPQKALKAYLIEHGQAWRDDSSNASDQFARNRVRKFLADRPDVTEQLLQLAGAASDWRRWVESAAPTFPDDIPLAILADLPDPLARNSLRRWLRSHQIDITQVAPEQIEQLITMARDRSTAATLNLPQGRIAHRRAGKLSIDPSS